MTIIIYNTSKTVFLNGVEMRVWEGKTENGVPMHAYIARVSVAEDADAKEFEAELRETSRPSPAIEAIPLRMIL